MKLSQIVGYRNLLNQFDLATSCNEATRNLDAFVHTVTNNPVRIREYTGELEQDFDRIRTSYNQFNTTVDALKTQLSIMIREQSVAYYQESYRLWEQEMCWETDEYILNRRLRIDEESNLILRSHLRNCADWRVPGMIIRPGKETFIEDLVPLDPLYLVDHSQELMDHSMGQFTPEYQRRLRPYPVNDYAEPHSLRLLPDGQFGLIFAYNYFNYKPLEIIQRYLDQMYLKLRLGGRLIMTYNDCDLEHGVALAEQNFMCYTPGSEIIKYAESVGYKLLYRYTGEGDLCWIELQKPGEITSLRGGQTLAKIIPK